jgi:hypothetical protein
MTAEGKTKGASAFWKVVGNDTTRVQIMSLLTTYL